MRHQILLEVVVLLFSAAIRPGMAQGPCSTAGVNNYILSLDSACQNSLQDMNTTAVSGPAIGDSIMPVQFIMFAELETACTDDCVGAIVVYMNNCGDAETALAYAKSCARSGNGTFCTEVLQSTADTAATNFNLSTACPIDQQGQSFVQTCPESICLPVIQELADSAGCCLNLFSAEAYSTIDLQAYAAACEVNSQGQCHIPFGDLDRCSIQFCDHNCTSITGGYICSCMSGYYLHPDGIQCIPENSSPPSFTEPAYNFSVVENNATAFVGQVAAIDSDGDDITFYLTGFGSPNFNIDPSGVITTTSALDHEAQVEYNLNIFARDDGIPGMSSSASVTVYIEDVNDIAPEFSQSSYSVAVPENLAFEATIGMVIAIDPDVESLVMYVTVNQTPDFSIDEFTGLLFSASPLDYETQTSYSILVQACDLGNLCTTATVLIEVLDIDDNDLFFDYISYSATIYQDTPIGSILFQAVAIDHDTGINAAFVYDIDDINGGLFNISSNGLVTLEQDLQLAACDVHYDMVGIRAINNLIPIPRPVSAELNFYVPCVNPNVLQFSATYYAFTILENSDDFEETLSLAAGVEENIGSIEILEGRLPHPFLLNGLTLCLKNDSQLDALGLSDPFQPGLDREIGDTYTVVIQAVIEDIEATTTVTLTVLDVNDNPPVFPFPVYNLQLAESAPNPESTPPSVATVLSLEAQDDDTGSNAILSYQLTTGGETGVFSVDTSSGELLLVNTLDREAQPEYNLTICAYDGLNEGCTSVIVTVDDINDNEPVFPLDDITVSIPENTPPETVVLTAMAVDADIGSNGDITYSLLPLISDFDIDENTGEIITAGELDFAITAEYSFTILATDQGLQQLSAFAQVTINVENINNGLPQFSSNEYNVSISESASVGSTIFTALAVDTNNDPIELEYSLIVDQGIFTVTNSSMEAVILLESTLDREERDTYVLGLRAREVNDPTRYFAVPVYITILDSNDNAPVFTNFQSNIPIGENVASGYVLTNVSAVDADIGSNAAIFFSVVDTNGSFAINESTGFLFVTETQGIEILNEYFVTIQANDRTSSPRTSQSVVIVTVTNSVLCSCCQPDYIRQIAACTTVQGSDCQCTQQNCTQQNCTCPDSYVGDGSLCSMDTDGDGFPDVSLPTCTEELSNLDYCRTDNCPTIPNPELQDVTACVFCLSEDDMEWNLPWNLTASDSTATNQCPNNGEGMATRYCYPHGVWDLVNVLGCTSRVFISLMQEAAILSSTASTEEKLEVAASILFDLRTETDPTSATRLLPQDLVTTNALLNNIVNFYAQTLEEISSTGCIEILIDIIDNLLDPTYVDEWQELEAESDREILLSSIEQFGKLIASVTAQTDSMNQTSLNGSNIVLEARARDRNDEQVIVFPDTGSPFSTEPQFNIPRARISIPSSVIFESQPEIDRVSLVNIVMNMQNILPAVENTGGNNIRTVAASMALSTQVLDVSSLTLNTPVQLVFTTEPIEGAFNPRCVFRDFSLAAWSTSGVQTSSVAIQRDGELNAFSVVCETNHFTTFVVLVDIAEAFCSCVPMPIGGMVFPTCGDNGMDACQCTQTGCTCQLPFIGDGEACTFDYDNDGIPNRRLPTCTEQQENPNYCKEDNCPFDYNPNQDIRACEEIVEEEFDGCQTEVDEVWSIQWNDTFSGVYDTQPCPENRIGLAIRLCNTGREWESVNVTACQSEEFMELSQQVEEALDETSGQSTVEITETVIMITEELSDATNTADETPLYPQEIAIATDIVDDVVTFHLDAVDEPITGNDTAVDFNSALIQVFDRILNGSNTDAWMQLEDANSTASETLLMNAEEYGLYVAAALATNTTDTGNASEIPLSGSFGNIELEARLQEANEELNDVIFPVREKAFTTEPQFEDSFAQIKLPAERLRERADQDGATSVSTVNIVMMNIQDFLPDNVLDAQISQSNDSNTTVTTAPATMVLSSQIVTDVSSTPRTLNTKAQLVFTTNPIVRGINARCAFWNFSKRAWDTSGVDTVSVRNQSANNSNTFHVVCETQHLTSFSVLVDVTGQTFNPIEGFALEVVSFIGCGVSMFFLLLTIIFFLSFGKELFKSVHYFVHLNLAIALFLGYLTFVSGIETAVNSKVACKFVAALLHYFFLSVFCWMLCEGIMIYLLLVVVFSGFSKRWWIFFLIGWGLPLVIVSIAVGIAHEQYAPEGQEYCWISVENGAIWAFVGPMLAVICINLIFLILALRNFYKVQSAKLDHNIKGTQKFLARKLMLAAMTLLPLLGLTWVFGLLSVNKNTTVFVWIFTILNSTQGVFIFIFHVLRSEKVWTKMREWLPCLKKSKLDQTTSQSVPFDNRWNHSFPLGYGLLLYFIMGRVGGVRYRSKRKLRKQLLSDNPDFSITTGKRRKNSDEIGLTTRTWIN